MVKLVETNSVLLGRELNIGQQSYVEVSAIGDGNCAFNAFALGLIDLIHRGELKAQHDQKSLNALLSAIQNESNLKLLIERQKLYANEASELVGNAYEDIADELKQFITFVKSKPTVNRFIEYIKNKQSRIGIAALHVALAPALRQIGVDSYIQSLQGLPLPEDDELFTDANNLKRDGEVAGQDVLMPLANIFNVNLHTKIDRKQADSIVSEKCGNDARPSITLIHLPGHYNYAYPQDQIDGLASCLSRVQPNLSSDTHTDLALVSGEYHAQIQKKNHKKELITKNQMIEVANLVNLEADVILENNAQSKVLDASITAIANVVKQNIISASEDGQRTYEACVEQVLDRRSVSSRQSETSNTPYKEAVKALLFNGVTTRETDDVSDDEILARALQHAEILSFLNENFDALTGNKKQSDHRHSLRRR